MGRYKGPRAPVIYRLYDKDYALIYVGASSNFEARLRKHRRINGWYGAIHRIELQRFDTMALAYRAERIAITRENPRHNTTEWNDSYDEKTRAKRDRAYQAIKAKAKRESAYVEDQPDDEEG